MSATPTTHEPLSPDDALPPVQPPTAGFIIQLFVIPGLIVAIIVLVWLTLNSLAHMGGGVDADLAALERNNDDVWQAAANLVFDLQSASADVRRDDARTARAAAVLEQRIRAGSTAEKQVTLRVILCSALGRFESMAGLPSLLLAARTERHPDEQDVRRAALKAIGDLAVALAAHQPPQVLRHPDLHDVVLRAAADSTAHVRAAAAFTLGALGDAALRQPLVDLLADPHVDARYNAATGLARQGDPAGLQVLSEMLDPHDSAAVAGEPHQDGRDAKAELVYLNGLRAVYLLAERSPQLDLSSFEKLVAALAEAPLASFAPDTWPPGAANSGSAPAKRVSVNVRNHAQDLRRRLEARHAAPGQPPPSSP
jgi:hypothetical protein